MKLKDRVINKLLEEQRDLVEVQFEGSILFERGQHICYWGIDGQTKLVEWGTEETLIYWKNRI